VQLGSSIKNSIKLSFIAAASFTSLTYGEKTSVKELVAARNF